MRNIRSRNTVKDWARLAAKVGLALTEPGVRAAIGEQVNDRVHNVTDTIADKYEDAVERLEAAGAALQGRRRYWPPRTIGFLLGVGVGAGLGILLAPGSGTETREAIRDKAVDVKNRVVATMPSTGT